MRLLVVALIAALGITAVAVAQTNSYSIDAKVPSGGSKKKPKAGGFTFNFTVADQAGANIPQVIQTYSLGIEGSKVNTNVVPTCAASKAATDDSVCSKKALIGTGSITAVDGSAGQPLDSRAADCVLDLRIYNGGKNKATIFVQQKAEPAGNCAGAVPGQAIDAKWTKANGGTALVFTVPEVLRHPVANTDAVVIAVTSKFKKITKTIKHKKVGYFESIGCKDKSRTVTATFTDEKGDAVPYSTDIGKC